MMILNKIGHIKGRLLQAVSMSDFANCLQNYFVSITVAGIILGTSSGCTMNQEESLIEHTSSNANSNIYYEHFISEYTRINENATRQDAEELLRNSILKNSEPIRDVLRGSVNKIVVFEHVDLINTYRVSEFGCDDIFVKKLLAALRDSSSSIGKMPQKYTLFIHFNEMKDPLQINVQGGLFQIKGIGMYWSKKNLESIITKGVQSKGSVERVSPE